eukprot:8988766-Pyramimonas_sp.AAC.2
MNAAWLSGALPHCAPSAKGTVGLRSPKGAAATDPGQIELHHLHHLVHHLPRKPRMELFPPTICQGVPGA